MTYFRHWQYVQGVNGRQVRGVRAPLVHSVLCVLSPRVFVSNPWVVVDIVRIVGMYVDCGLWLSGRVVDVTARKKRGWCYIVGSQSHKVLEFVYARNWLSPEVSRQRRAEVYLLGRRSVGIYVYGQATGRRFWLWAILGSGHYRSFRGQPWFRTVCPGKQWGGSRLRCVMLWSVVWELRWCISVGLYLGTFSGPRRCSALGEATELLAVMTYSGALSQSCFGGVKGRHAGESFESRCSKCCQWPTLSTCPGLGAERVIYFVTSFYYSEIQYN
eukprot:jgi/Mesvir1/22934/Mv25836-RA.1